MRQLLPFSLIALIAVPALTSREALAADSFEAEGTAVKAAGSINPPNPIEYCDKAKADAKSKAAAAGFKGRVEWQHLSVDSDCKLTTSTPSAGTATFFIFTAKGKFFKSS